jgi:hypothetical protein
MASEITIPLLPCRSIDEVLEFYRAIGFDVTYQQSRPNNYAVVQRGGIELHFFSMREYVPANSYSSCYVRVGDVDALCAAFVKGLREKYGRLPSAGIPRVIPLKNKAHGVREFIVVDPGGNWIRIGQVGAHSSANPEADARNAAKSNLGKAVHTAGLLADSKGDNQAAAKFLDAALADFESAPNADCVRALVARAALAVNMGDSPRAEECLHQVRGIALTDAEQIETELELQTAADLEQMLQGSARLP